MPVFLKQSVNQWLCIALISLLGFWTTLYYLTNKAEAISGNIGTSHGVYEELLK